MIYILFLLLGMGVGLIGGYFGIAGGAILVPILTAYYISRGIDIDIVATTAFGTSLFTGIFLTGASAFKQWKQKNILLSLIMWLVIGALIGAPGGSFLGSTLQGSVLIKAFGVLIVLMAFNIAFSKKTYEDKCEAIVLSGSRRFALVSIGFAAGLIGATFGLGGGILLIPALLLCKYPAGKVSGTSAMVAFFVSLSGVVGYQMFGTLRAIDEPGFLGVVDLKLGIPLAIGVVLTAPIGAKLNKRFGGGAYQKAFALLLFAIGIRMFLT